MRNQLLERTFSRSSRSRRVPQQYERGQAIVIVALALIGLIGFAGLVLDGGTAYIERRRMENAAEAGAMAGAYKLAFGGSNTTNQQVVDAIQKYVLTYNGRPRYGGQITSYEAYYIDANGNYLNDESGQRKSVKDNPGQVRENTVRGVEVVPATTFNTFFMNVLGMPIGTAKAAAKAIYGPINNIPNHLSPIAPKCKVPNPTSFADCGYQVSSPSSPYYYNLWEGGGPGNFGWLNWDNNNPADCTPGGGQGVPELCQNLRHPDTMTYTHNCNPLPDNTVSVGDCVDATTGVKNSSNIVDALISLVDSQTSVTVPIWGTASGSGSTLSYNIVAFATFVITGFSLPQGAGAGGGTQYGNADLCYTGGLENGTGACIVGYFVGYADVNSSGDLCPPPCAIPDTGTYTIGLIGP